MENLKFSVLMSVYCKESAEYFDLALKSNLCDQTLKPDEFVLVCDGPLTKELDAVIEKYKGLYPNILKICPLEKNVGLGNALNYGLEYCSYEFVARADSDDICVPERFEKQIAFFAANPGVDILGSWIDEFNEDYNTPTSQKQMPTDHKGVVSMAKRRNPVNHMTVMFKKSVITGVGSYEELPLHEDYYLWVRAIVNGAKFANIGEYLVHARVGNGMLKRRGKKVIIKSRYVLNKYMLKHKMINPLIMIRNVGGMAAFIFAPTSLKNFAYKYILRNGNRK